MNSIYKKTLIVFSLFGSASTLICCALPALFVALGAGSVFASLITRVPQLIWFSEHKISLFIFAGVMLTTSGVVQWSARNAACPIDPKLAAGCRETRKFSQWIYGISIGFYLLGLSFAFVLPVIRKYLDF